MLPISSFNPAYNYNNRKSICFTSNKPIYNVANNNYITNRAAKLLAGMDDTINSLWKECKKNKLTNLPDIIAISPKSGQTLTIRPIYNNKENSLLLEYEERKRGIPFTHQIIISRTKPYNYIYQVITNTAHGTATIKEHNSKKVANSQVENLISGKIEEFFPSIIEDTYLKEKFGINYKEVLGL